MAEERLHVGSVNRVYRVYPSYLARTQGYMSGNDNFHPHVPHQFLVDRRYHRTKAKTTELPATAKAQNKARKAKRIRVKKDRYVIYKHRHQVEVRDDAPGIEWRDGQTEFTKVQRKFLYEQSVTLASIKVLSEAMSMHYDSLRAALERNPQVWNKMQRIKQLTLSTLRGEIVAQALKGDVQLMLRVLGSHGIFNERTISEVTSTNVHAKAKLGKNLKELDLDQLRERYQDVLNDDSE